MNSPAILGAIQWPAIHCAAYRLDRLQNQPERNSKVGADLAHYLSTISSHIGCGLCVRHTEEYIQKHPLPRFGEGTFQWFRWSWGLHNAANLDSGKASLSLPEAKVSFEEQLQNPKTLDLVHRAANLRLEDQARIKRMQAKYKRDLIITLVVCISVIVGLLVCLGLKW